VGRKVHRGDIVAYILFGAFSLFEIGCVCVVKRRLNDMSWF
jgi:uncharacterized membrane protein